ncbi:DUF3341 domain-containing protein [Calidithermus roseus]|uniref:Quinol:cytochrome c oxidoreductase membrane protein n=1 Tax=Calidithermus roseus TaxID=1644118 RepID=A0A399ERL1_9DEIN|nr:DUF3341 domain-containing protein [Calidithermus roseus]RIH86213.1 hypothetical protein Mrose_01871 [Calidithermus roseus]
MLHGLAAHFETPEDLLDAVPKARAAGYRYLEAYTPFPVEGLVDALGTRDERIPWIAFTLGAIGAIGGFALQAWVQVAAYPLNIGGKPLLAWPAYIPITFELTILTITLGLFVTLLALNGLPLSYHPVTRTPGYRRALVDRFVLVVEARDPQFDLAQTRRFLEELGAAVEEVRD